MSVKYRKQFTPYKEEIVNKTKSKTIQGQALPMRMIVERYASGQLFGISQIPVQYDEESELENKLFPDPCDPLFPERALIEHNNFRDDLQKSKN